MRAPRTRGVQRSLFRQTGSAYVALGFVYKQVHFDSSFICVICYVRGKH